MKTILYILLFLSLNSFVFSQANINNPTSEKKPHPELASDDSYNTGAYATGLQTSISNHEKEILAKIALIEKLQIKISELNKSIQNTVIINDESPVIAANSHLQIVSSRQLEFSFQNSKVKEIKITSSKRNLKNDLNSIIRILTFEPGNFSEIKIKVDRFESKIKGVSQVEAYHEMPPEARIHVIRLIDQVLLNTINRFETFIQKNKGERLENTINNVKEL